RRSLCGQFGDCTAITTGVCRFPLLARPCGSPSIYLDYGKLAGRLGWKMLHGGWCVWPEDVPDDMPCYNLGIVLID
ncbi:MAG: hypothetical protein HYY09_00665, partial [Firmicutes bacterium]|nr:hypothetical protein [Bacillota bacterium]